MYEIKAAPAPRRINEYAVYLNGKPVFYGDRIECTEWLERNGHDEEA